MNRSRTRTPGLAILTTIVGILLTAVPAPGAHAAELTGFITGVTVTSDTGFIDGSTIRQNISWCVPTNTVEGDTFHLTLPAAVALSVPETFELSDGQTNSAATAHRTNSTPPYTYTLTVTNFGATHPGLCRTTTGILAQLAPGLVQNNQPTPTTLTYTSGTDQFQTNIVLTPIPAATHITISSGDLSGQPGTTAQTAADLGTSTTSTINITVTNTGADDLTNIWVIDNTIQGGTVDPNPWCRAPGAYNDHAGNFFGLLHPGESLQCHTALSNVAPGTIHQSQATVHAQNATTGTAYEASVMFYATNHTPAPSTARVSVGGSAWEDLNDDQTKGPGELGVAGTVVSISRTDGLPVTTTNGAIVAADTTDTTGGYVFSELAALPIGVGFVVMAAPPAGWFRHLFGSTTRYTSTDMSVDGASELGLDFGFYKPVPAVTITENDTSGNAGDTPGTAVDLGYEPGSIGLVFTITNTGNETLTSINISDQVVRGGLVSALSCDYPQIIPMSVGDGTRSDAGGQWDGWFEPGQTITCTATLTSVTADTIHHDDSTITAVGIDSGTTAKATNPFYAKAHASVTLGDTVWLDTDRDGVQDPGEPGIAGVTLKVTRTDGQLVTDIHGNPVGQVTTDAQGHYGFTNLPTLPTGVRYVVTVVSDTGLGMSPGNTGTAESGVLSGNDADTSLDFGYYPNEPYVPSSTPTEPPTATIDSGIPGQSPTSMAGVAAGVLLVFAGLVGVVVSLRRRTG